MNSSFSESSSRDNYLYLHHVLYTTVEIEWSLFTARVMPETREYPHDRTVSIDEATMFKYGHSYNKVQ